MPISLSVTAGSSQSAKLYSRRAGECRKREQIRSLALACYFLANFSAIYVRQNVSIPKNGSVLLLSVNNWIVIQQRLDGSVDFSVVWAAYQVGFGDINGDFWLGLESMNELTYNADYRLRVEVQSDDNGKWASAEYDLFHIKSKVNGYAIKLSGYVGDAGDGLRDSRSDINEMKFTTIDVDNDMGPGNCAVSRGGGGWWYNFCHMANLNCPVGSVEFCWIPLLEKGIASTPSLQKSRMMIKLA